MTEYESDDDQTSKSKTVEQTFLCITLDKFIDNKWSCIEAASNWAFSNDSSQYYDKEGFPVCPYNSHSYRCFVTFGESLTFPSTMEFL